MVRKQKKIQDDNYLKKELYSLIKLDESIFDFIQDSSLDGMWYWDLKHPEEEWMSPNFWTVLGYEPEKMPNKSSAWQDFIHPEDLKLANENITKHLENPDYPYDQTVRYTHKNGSTVWIRCRGMAVRDENGVPIRMLGAHQNVTQYKKSELRIEKSSKFLKKSQFIAQVGSWELNLESNEVFWTEELYRIYGFNPLLPPPAFTDHKKLFTLDSWERLKSAVKLTIEKGTPYELELQIIKDNGSKGWIWARGEAVRDGIDHITGLTGIAQDITKRKTTELEKEELTKRLKYASDASGEGIWDLDIITNRTIYSKAWVEMIGHDISEINPNVEEWMSRLHPDETESILEELKRVSQSPDHGDSFLQEYRFRCKSGDYLWILNQGKVVERNENGEATRIVGTHKNITERKRAEEQFKRTSMLLEDAQRLSQSGTWELDLETNKTFWTEQVYRIHEVENNFDHNKLNGLDFYHPDDKSRISKAISEAIEKQIPFDIKCKFISKKNNLKHVRVSGYPFIKDKKVTRVIGIIKDITQEEKDKEAIKREQLFSKQLLENMADGFSVIDVEGRQVGVNKAFCEMTGFSENELIGHFPPYPYWPEEEIENVNSAYQKTLNGNFNTFELIFCKKNGQRFPVLVSSSELKDESGKIINYFANIKDITEIKKNESDIKDYVTIVEGQNERLKNFAYIVSHNLRSHSANINGLLDIMEIKHPEFRENQYIQYLKTASANLENTLHSLNDIVSVVSSKHEMEKIALRPFVENFQSSFKTMLEENSVEFINEISHKVKVEAVPAFLESIINNLITNAIKYRDPNKKSFVKLYSKKSKKHVILAVEDNGLGLDLRKYGHKLFGMYKTFHNHKDAKGIGLFLTKNQIESMGGKITIDSKVGKGSTFKVYFKHGSI
jgi:PAS domain S-box-containing protein